MASRFLEFRDRPGLCAAPKIKRLPARRAALNPWHLPILFTENHIDAGDDETGLCGREFVYEFRKQTTVERHDLRNVGDGILGQPGYARVKQHISGCVGPLEVAGKRDADRSGNATSVNGVALNDYYGSSESRSRSGRRRQISPPNLALRYHHSARFRRRLDADAVNLSGCGSTSAQTRSMASVISSDACRATYSLTASLNNWLRDFFVRRASLSATLKISSGMEIAVFILLV